jgi:cytochrome c556
MFGVTRPLASAVVLGVVLGIVLAAGTAAADDGMIKYRQSVMKANGGHLGAVVGIVKGEVPFTDDLKVHTQALAELAKIAGHVFPEGSGTGDTRALPAIWEKPDEFKKAYMAYLTAAANLAKTAETEPTAVPAAVGALGKACKGCHDNFQKKKP